VGLLNALARAYQQVGDLPHAAAALKRSLALKPEQPEQQKLLQKLAGSRSSSTSSKAP